MKSITLTEEQMNNLDLLIDYLQDGGRDECMSERIALEYDLDFTEDIMGTLVDIFNASLDEEEKSYEDYSDMRTCDISGVCGGPSCPQYFGCQA